MTPAQMHAAAVETLALARDHGMDRMSSDNPNADYDHLAEMAEKMAEFGENKIGKAGRWLGWIQACVHIGTEGQVTLEDLKEINRIHNSGDA